MVVWLVYVVAIMIATAGYRTAIVLWRAKDFLGPNQDRAQALRDKMLETQDMSERALLNVQATDAEFGHSGFGCMLFAYTLAAFIGTVVAGFALRAIVTR